MAEEREIDAWIAASKMNDDSYMFVEGNGDINFWKRFIDEDAIKLRQLNGWEKVTECVRKFNEEGLDKYCFGVIDADFERIHPHKGVSEYNIFMTDLHDIEMMMFNSSALDAVINSMDKKNKLTVSPKNILDDVLAISDRIGYLKLSSLKNNLKLTFYKQDNDNDKMPPDYGKLIDKNGDYKKDEKMLNVIWNFSKTNTRLTSHPLMKDVEAAFNNTSSVKYDSLQLSNGHDVTDLIPRILKSKYKLKGNQISPEALELAIRSAYDERLLSSTTLYTSISNWASVNGKTVFKTP